MHRLQRLFILCGLLAPAWLLIGVTVSGWLYPAYNHYSQAMSELHAVGSPIERIAPFINHYPLTLFFVGFGLAVTGYFDQRAIKTSGWIIVLHGLATFAAGYFPCDLACQPDNPSLSHNLHGIAGLVLIMTCLVAPALWIAPALKSRNYKWLGWLSLLCIVCQLATFPLIVAAMQEGVGFGIYQRIAYAIPMVWLVTLAWQMLTGKLDDQSLAAVN